MSAQVFEKVLARLYTDAAFRTSFLENPLQALADEDLNADERDAFTRIDKAGLVMAAHSFLHKQESRASRTKR